MIYLAIRSPAAVCIYLYIWKYWLFQRGADFFWLNYMNTILRFHRGISERLKLIGKEQLTRGVTIVAAFSVAVAAAQSLLVSCCTHVVTIVQAFAIDIGTSRIVGCCS